MLSHPSSLVGRIKDSLIPSRIPKGITLLGRLGSSLYQERNDNWNNNNRNDPD